MRKHLTLAKVAAVICSILLLCGYVYVRAGGTFWLGAAQSEASPQTQTAPELFPGSKSAPVEFAAPSEGPPASPGGSSNLSPPSVAQGSHTVIMAGSKSAAVFTPPAESSTAGSPQLPPAAGQPAAQAGLSQPQDAGPRQQPTRPSQQSGQQSARAR
jgi:hypothetical protein